MFKGCIGLKVSPQGFRLLQDGELQSILADHPIFQQSKSETVETRDRVGDYCNVAGEGGPESGCSSDESPFRPIFTKDVDRLSDLAVEYILSCDAAAEDLRSSEFFKEVRDLVISQICEVAAHHKLDSQEAAEGDVMFTDIGLDFMIDAVHGAAMAATGRVSTASLGLYMESKFREVVAKHVEGRMVEDFTRK